MAQPVGAFSVVVIVFALGCSNSTNGPRTAKDASVADASKETAASPPDAVVPDPDTGKICTPLDKFCHGQDLLLCQGDGMTVLLVETCPPDKACDVALGCFCKPMCDGKACGGDGCGGACGECSAPATCQEDGTCACLSTCGAKGCGDDGCGGSCGTCSLPKTCQPGGVCGCIPQCDGKKCGDDSCGGSCGDCTPTNACTSAADDALFTDPTKDVSGKTGNCGIGCIGKKDAIACAQPCIIKDTGVTSDCALCLAIQIDCAIKNCIGECAADPGGKPCCQCRLDKKCVENFSTCSGRSIETCN